MFIAHRILRPFELRRSDMLLLNHESANEQNMPLPRSFQNRLMECAYKHFTPSGVVL